MQVTTIGLDIAKNVFQVHEIDAAEKVVVRKQLRREPGARVLQDAAGLPGWHGSLRDGPLLGARTDEAWSSGATDAGEGCEGYELSATRTMQLTPRRSVRRCDGRPCASCRSSRRSSRAF